MTTRERTKTGKIYWMITTDGTRYVGWPANSDETEASLMTSLEKWIDKHLMAVRY